MCSYQLTKSGCCVCTSFYGRLNSAYITTYHNSYKTGTDLLCSYKCNVSCLAHLVSCLDSCCKSSGFYHS